MVKQHFIFPLIAGTLLVACGGSETPTASNDDASQPAALSSADKRAAATTGSPGKPSAPIHFRYEVQGNPIVGQPVAVNVFVTSSVRDRPISLRYRVNDSTSMSFPSSQSRRKDIITDASYDSRRPEQITVIPQREGRLFLNVSAEIVMEDGDVLLKSQAIPIQVGAAPLELDENGELKETADGETVVSMPST